MNLPMTTQTSPVFYIAWDSPIGKLLLTSDGTALTGLYMGRHQSEQRPRPEWQQAEEPFQAVCEQLAAYFASERFTFNLPLAARGTAFQERVWAALRKIPYGETVSYGAIARRIGRPTAARAVGAANGQNPISIIVPCHRVIGADGSLTGYGGGLERKKKLLQFEASNVSLFAAEAGVE